MPFIRVQTTRVVISLQLVLRRSSTITRLNDFVFKLGKQEFSPLVVGGMGVDVSTPELVLSVAKLGGIAHLSDAMIQAVVDRHLNTHFVQAKCRKYKDLIGQMDKSPIRFDPEEVRLAIDRYVRPVMNARSALGAVFINVMEKLTMADPRGTLRMRLHAALDAGIDGITLSAGLHLSTLDMISDHPRFRDVKLGIIASSARALKLFLQRAAKVGRMPDYIVVEGPLAGGHLGFPLNWQDFDLKEIVRDVMQLLEDGSLQIPVIPAGGIFTGADAVAFMEMGASAVQVATRFAVAQESGLPDEVKQAFFAAKPEDVVVNMLSAAGYPMRMLTQSPAIGSRVEPMCEAFGYVLDGSGGCSYLDYYYQQAGTDPQVKAPPERTCLCAMMHAYKIWTCGHTVSRLKETALRLANGEYETPSTEQVFAEYLTGS